MVSARWIVDVIASVIYFKNFWNLDQYSEAALLLPQVFE